MYLFTNNVWSIVKKINLGKYPIKSNEVVSIKRRYVTFISTKEIQKNTKEKKYELYFVA